MKLGRSSSVVLGFACLVLAAGCSAGATEDTEGTGGGAAAQSAAAGPERAVLTTKAIDASMKARTPTELFTDCTITGSYLEVSGLPASAAGALNAAITPTELSDFHANACEDPYTVETRAKSLMNERGVLTIEYSGNSYYSGANHPNAWLFGKSYLLATGAKLELADVFADASGKEIVEKVLATLAAGSEEQKAVAETYGEAMRSNPDWLPFVLLPEGVSFYFTAYAGHADFALALADLVIPYADLRGALKASSPAARVWATTAGTN